MATVSVTITDSVPVLQGWGALSDDAGLRSPIPQGLLIFSGKTALAAKGAGDVTSLSVVLDLPTGYAYLPRNIAVRVQSDDLVNNYNDNAYGFYVRALPKTTGIEVAAAQQFNMACPGEFVNVAASAGRIWVPGRGMAKLIMQGGDTITMRFSDMDAGASTAGDEAHYAEFYVFQTDQVDKWEVNTPIPVIDHSSF